MNQALIQKLKDKYPIILEKSYEKFGGLRMYKEGYYDDYIDGIIRFAESISFKTCEVTGSPGQKCVKGGWIRTLCEEQIKIQGFK